MCQVSLLNSVMVLTRFTILGANLRFAWEFESRESAPRPTEHFTPKPKSLGLLCTRATATHALCARGHPPTCPPQRLSTHGVARVRPKLVTAIPDHTNTPSPSARRASATITLPLELSSSRPPSYQSSLLSHSTRHCMPTINHQSIFPVRIPPLVGCHLPNC